MNTEEEQIQQQLDYLKNFFKQYGWNFIPRYYNNSNVAYIRLRRGLTEEMQLGPIERFLELSSKEQHKFAQERGLTKN